MLTWWVICTFPTLNNWEKMIHFTWGFVNPVSWLMTYNRLFRWLANVARAISIKSHIRPSTQFICSRIRRHLLSRSAAHRSGSSWSSTNCSTQSSTPQHEQASQWARSEGARFAEVSSRQWHKGCWASQDGEDAGADQESHGKEEGTCFGLHRLPGEHG